MKTEDLVESYLNAVVLILWCSALTNFYLHCHRTETSRVSIFVGRVWVVGIRFMLENDQHEHRQGQFRTGVKIGAHDVRPSQSGCHEIVAFDTLGVGRNGKCFLVGTMLSLCSFCVVLSLCSFWVRLF